MSMTETAGRLAELQHHLEAAYTVAEGLPAGGVLRDAIRDALEDVAFLQACLQAEARGSL